MTRTIVYGLLAVVGIVAAGVALLCLTVAAIDTLLSRPRQDRRGGLIHLDTPEARKRIGQPW